ncbi:Nucleoporin [Penicillium expansum]|nr:Nucleoporin [Penicillium expansum]
MPYKSRWTIDIPDTHLASLLLKSPTAPLSKTHKSYLEAARPETHYLTTHDLRLWSQRLAAGLRKSGLQPGDRVLLFSGNDLFFPVVFLGVIMAGGIFTGANPTFKPSNKRTSPPNRIFAYDNSIYDGVATPQKGCAHWSDLLATEEEGSAFIWDELDTPALSSRTLALNYSSGTTGRPKGVEISHKNYVANMLQYCHTASLHPDNEARVARSRWLCFLPMYHAMAQNIFIAAALYRATPVYIMPKFDFVKMLEYTQEYRITDFILVPPVVVALAKHPAVGQYDLSSVESVGSGAAPLGREVCEEVEKLWPPGKINIKQGWGMTEATCSVTGWVPTEISTSASVGELNANCEAKIMFDGSEVKERNSRGELWVRAPNVMKGYWRNEKATKETKTADGWLLTGDIAFVDDKGKFHVVDRMKELIKVKGNQVAPAELEALLLEHPAISDVAVIGVVKSFYSIFVFLKKISNNDERPRAYVVLRSGQSATANEIAHFLDNKVSAFKRITGGVVFLNAIPKNPSGKILRMKLREQAKEELKSVTAKL